MDTHSNTKVDKGRSANRLANDQLNYRLIDKCCVLQLTGDPVETPENYKRVIVLVLSLASTLAPIGGRILLPALYLFHQQYEIGYGAVSLITAIYSLGLGIGPLWSGSLSNKFGRRSVIIWAALTGAISSLGCFMCSGFRFFLMFRFLQGCGFSSLQMVSGQILGDIHVDDQQLDGRKCYLHWPFYAVMYSTIITPIVGGYLSEKSEEFFGWNASLVIMSITSFSWGLILVTLMVPETSMMLILGEKQKTGEYGNWQYALTNFVKSPLSMLSPLASVSSFLVLMTYGICQGSFFGFLFMLSMNYKNLLSPLALGLVYATLEAISFLIGRDLFSNDLFGCGKDISEHDNFESTIAVDPQKLYIKPTIAGIFLEILGLLAYAWTPHDWGYLTPLTGFLVSAVGQIILVLAQFAFFNSVEPHTHSTDAISCSAGFVRSGVSVVTVILGPLTIKSFGVDNKSPWFFTSLAVGCGVSVCIFGLALAFDGKRHRSAV